MTRVEPTDVEHEVKSVDLIVSKSDIEGKITYVNPIFIKISGYTHASLLEQPHAILRHPDMPKVVFKYLWENIQESRDVVAYVKNLCADGGYYWVLATVKIAKNPDGSFRNYMSTRKCITLSAKNTISELYAKWLEVEKNEGVDASEALFKNFLVDNALSDSSAFNEYMKNLNK